MLVAGHFQEINLYQEAGLQSSDMNLNAFHYHPKPNHVAALPSSYKKIRTQSGVSQLHFARSPGFFNAELVYRMN